jgi:ComEC/Rec2-related protein
VALLEAAHFFHPARTMFPTIGLLLLAFARESHGFQSQFLMWLSPLHQFCLEALPISDFKPLSAGLVCGAPLPVGESTAQLRGMGMAHIIVVSGAHLLWLEHWYRRLTPRSFHFLIGPLLLIYCGVSLFQPPAVRSLFQWTVTSISDRYRLHWSLENRLVLSLLLSWIFEPSWSNSLSLLLSWLAGLGVCLGPLIFKRAKSLQPVIISAVLLPALAPFGGLTALQLVSNLTVTPLVAAGIFPVSMVSLIFPPLVYAQDFIWTTVFWFGEQIQGLSHLTLTTPSLSQKALWAYSLVVLTTLSVLRRHRKRTDCTAGEL